MTKIRTAEIDDLLRLFPGADAERAGYLLNDLELIPRFNIPATFLDMGAGSGSMAAIVSRFFPGISGVLFDVVPRGEFLRQLGDQVNRNLVFLSTQEECELNGKEFDLVMSMDVLEHVPNWRKAMASLKEKVKNGGYLYVQVPSNYPSPNYKSAAIIRNLLAGYVGRNDPSFHVRHGLSVKSIVDAIGEGFDLMVAEENYVLNGKIPCRFKPRVHVLARKCR